MKLFTRLRPVPRRAEIMAWSAAALRDRALPHDLAHIVCDLAGYLALEADLDQAARGHVDHYFNIAGHNIAGGVHVDVELRAEHVVATVVHSNNAGLPPYVRLHVPGLGWVEGCLPGPGAERARSISLAVTPHALPSYLCIKAPWRDFSRVVRACLTQEAETGTGTGTGPAPVSLSMRIRLVIARHPVAGLVLRRDSAEPSADGALWGKLYETTGTGEEKRPLACGWVPQ